MCLEAFPTQSEALQESYNMLQVQTNPKAHCCKLPLPKPPPPQIGFGLRVEGSQTACISPRNISPQKQKKPPRYLQALPP